MDVSESAYWPPDPSGTSPAAWFFALSTFSQVITGIFLCGCLVVSLFVLPLAFDDEPGDDATWLWRVLAGPLLALALTWYYWQPIYHFCRWWLPYQSYWVQMGSALMVFFGLVLVGHNIECGLLCGGFGEKNILGWGKLQREHGVFRFVAQLVAFVSLIYGFGYPVYWLISALDTWRRS